MSEQTVTIWTCGRCGLELVLPVDQQPDTWKKLFGATPPRNPTKEVLGDLCDTCWPIAYEYATNPNA